LKRQRIIGVMGGGKANANSERDAYQLGVLIAQNGWILLNGGRNTGIMAASAKGASETGGLTIGILPDEETSDMSPHIGIPICTGMGSGRNVINVLSSDVVVACPGGAGTISEIALALKHGKPVICMGMDTGNLFADYLNRNRLHHTSGPQRTVSLINSLLATHLQ
jgi:uncharacterized protein (TIGR00725 family)